MPRIDLPFSLGLRGGSGIDAIDGLGPRVVPEGGAEGEFLRRTGGALAWQVPPTPDQVAGYEGARTFASIAALREDTAPQADAADIIRVDYAHDADDAVFNLVYAKSASTAPDDGGARIVTAQGVRYELVHQGVLNVALWERLASDQSDAERMARAAAYMRPGDTLTWSGTLELRDHDGDGILFVKPSGCALIGASIGGAVLRVADGEDYDFVVRGEPGDQDGSFVSFTVDGNRNTMRNLTGARGGIAGGPGSARTLYRDLLVRDVYGRSVQTDGHYTGSSGDLMAPESVSPYSRDVTLANVNVVNAGDKAISIRRTERCNYTSGHAETNPEDGNESASAVEASNSRDVTVSGVTYEHRRADFGPGVRVVNGSARVVMERVVGTGGRQSVIVLDSEDVTITDCRLTGAGLHGILIGNTDLDGSGETTDRVLIADTAVIDPKGDGVVVYVADNGTSTTGVIVRGCEFHGAGRMSKGLRLGGDNGGTLEARQWDNIVTGQTDAAIDGAWGGAPGAAGATTASGSYVKRVDADDLPSGNYKLLADDAGRYLRMAINRPYTLEIDADILPVGATVVIANRGSGLVTLGGTSVGRPSGTIQLDSQDVLTIVAVASNSYDVIYHEEAPTS